VVQGIDSKRLPTNISNRTKELSKDSELKLLQSQINLVMKYHNDAKDNTTYNRLLGELMDVSSDYNKINNKSKSRSLDLDLHKIKPTGLKKIKDVFEQEY